MISLKQIKEKINRRVYRFVLKFVSNHKKYDLYFDISDNETYYVNQLSNGNFVCSYIKNHKHLKDDVKLDFSSAVDRILDNTMPMEIRWNKGRIWTTSIWDFIQDQWICWGKVQRDCRNLLASGKATSVAKAELLTTMKIILELNAKEFTSLNILSKIYGPNIYSNSRFSEVSNTLDIQLTGLVQDGALHQQNTRAVYTLGNIAITSYKMEREERRHRQLAVMQFLMILAVLMPILHTYIF